MMAPMLTHASGDDSRGVVGFLSHACWLLVEASPLATTPSMSGSGARAVVLAATAAGSLGRGEGREELRVSEESRTALAAGDQQVPPVPEDPPAASVEGDREATAFSEDPPAAREGAWEEPPASEDRPAALPSEAREGPRVLEASAAALAAGPAPMQALLGRAASPA